jgi:dihydrofolate synthase/folylpolyglutamate synthase
MNYGEAERYLLRLGRELAAPRQARGQKFDLENTRRLAWAMGLPGPVMCAQIAGTNGKGSTAAMLERIVRAGGCRTGLYTSPHLERMNERIRIDGEPVADDAFAASATRVAAKIEELMAAGTLDAHPTYFECMTVIAFDCFARAQTEFVVYEAGMGGRLDSTNVVVPEVTVITQIDFDHEEYLGHSIEEIGGEKAGIVKGGVPVVSAAGRADAREILRRRATEQRAPWIDLDEDCEILGVQTSGGYYQGSLRVKRTECEVQLAPGLPGKFQLRNAAAAALAAMELQKTGRRISRENIESGIRAARWPGRLERVRESPSVYLDGAHNPAAARELAEFWEKDLDGRRIFLVYAAMRDKAVDEIAGVLFPRTERVILTEPAQSRTLSASLLEKLTGHLAKTMEIVRSPERALERALELSEPEDAVFVTGSLYLVGEIRKSLKSGRVSGKWSLPDDG